jgi:hypothetical protein
MAEKMAEKMAVKMAVKLADEKVVKLVARKGPTKSCKNKYIEPIQIKLMLTL